MFTPEKKFPPFGMCRAQVHEVAAGLDSPTLLVLDVREEDRDWGYGHIRGSWHCPAKTLSAADLLDSIAPEVRRLVVHCAQSRARGPSAATALRSAAATQMKAGSRTEKLCIDVLSGGFDEWYEQGFPRCFCQGQQCRKTRPAPAAIPDARHEATPPPVLLLADTSLLNSPLHEERWDYAKFESLQPTRSGKRVAHRIIEALCDAARRRRSIYDARGAPLRAAFIGALSGDASIVHDAFRGLVHSQMGAQAEARTVDVFTSRALSPADCRFLEEADMIIVGGCVDAAYMRAVGHAQALPEGPLPGLRAMHAAGVFACLRRARASGALIVGIIEGAVVLGEGFLRDDSALSNGASDKAPPWQDDDDGAVRPPHLIPSVPQWDGAAATGGVSCGGVIGGTLVGVGCAATSRWPELCAALDAAGSATAQRAVGLSPRCGALLYPDGSVSAIGGDAHGRVSLFKRVPADASAPATSASTSALPAVASQMAAVTLEAAATAATAGGRTAEEPGAGAAAARPKLLRTLLVPSTAPFEAPVDGAPSALWEGPHAVAEAKLEAAVQALKGCRRIVAFTGAGISAESGELSLRIPSRRFHLARVFHSLPRTLLHRNLVHACASRASRATPQHGAHLDLSRYVAGMPTYRETVACDEPIDAQGQPTDTGAIDLLTPLWDVVDPAKAADIEAFHADPKAWWVRENALHAAFDHIEPNAAHVALAQLQAAGLLLGVVTQNIDGLHQEGGCTRVVELHGTIKRLECAGVPKRIMLSGNVGLSAAEEFRAAMSGAPIDDRCGYSCARSPQRVASALAARGAPSCPECGGYMKSATVLFGEQLPKQTTATASNMMMDCDGLLIVGTSLNVFPAAKYPGLVRGVESEASLSLSNVTLGLGGRGGGGAAAGRRRTGAPAPIVEVNAMASTSPALPDVMITGRAGEWLPRLAKRLIEGANEC